MPRPLRIGYLVPQFPGQTHIFFWREVFALEAMGHSLSLLSTRHPPQGLIAHDWSEDAIARTTCEFFREPDPQLGFLFGTGWLTMGMVLSAPLFLAGLVLVLRRKEPAAA